VGVFSYGYGEGNCPGATTLFTRVSTYAEWINEETSGGDITTERPVSTPKPGEDEYDEDEDYLE
jgi:secreted trypsin-like serine protease